MKRLLTLFLVLTAVFAFGLAHADQTLNGAGSTFAYPIYSAWAYDYSKVTGVKLNYQSIGSGGGIQQITNKTVDFGASDAPLTPTELKQKHFLQFPTVIGGVVPVVNIPGIKAGQMKMDSDVLSKIYLGEIKYWDDARIKALNPGLKLPHHEITSIHRSEGSGTTAIFTTYLSAVSPEWKSKVGSGTAVKWLSGIGAKGSEGVANYVRRVQYSIGYVEFSYILQEHMAYALMKNKEGRFVAPTVQSFKDAAGKADFSPAKDFYLWLVDAPGKTSWPIAGGTFILLSKDLPQANVKVAKFFAWAFKNGDPSAIRLAYVPLPTSLKNKILTYLRKNGIKF
ncbi:MAG: phosphate ABC transporter substrate-binding protein PstS, partial [Nitrospiraceae bacterium]|nr:phosphate ABC transporter substrate-binding protein PstS [Nitrospiraceae bacterium]